MDIEEIIFSRIGTIHSGFSEQRGTPIQARAGTDHEARVEVYPRFAEGLKDLDGFSYIYLIYHFDRSRKAELLQKPFLEDALRGVFAIRSPSRPNPIGISVVELLTIEDNILTVRGVDMLDGTPLLDIKPYVHEFDSPGPGRIGWLEGRAGDMRRATDDGRFGKTDRYSDGREDA